MPIDNRLRKCPTLGSKAAVSHWSLQNMGFTSGGTCIFLWYSACNMMESLFRLQVLVWNWISASLLYPLTSFKAQLNLLVSFCGKLKHTPQFALPHSQRSRCFLCIVVLYVAVLTFSVLFFGCKYMLCGTQSPPRIVVNVQTDPCVFCCWEIWGHATHYGCPVPFGIVLYRNLKGHVLLLPSLVLCCMPALLLLQGNGDGLSWRDKTGGVFHFG